MYFLRCIKNLYHLNNSTYVISIIHWIKFAKLQYCFSGVIYYLNENGSCMEVLQADGAIRYGIQYNTVPCSDLNNTVTPIYATLV